MNEIIVDRNGFGVFYRQQRGNYCGLGVLQTCLMNLFSDRINGIVNEDQEKLSSHVQELYIKLYEKKHGKKPSHKKYVIEEHGTDVYHFRNLADNLGLKTFTKLHGEINDLKYLMDNGIWPIIHRPFEEDHDGHFVLAYNYNSSVNVFDPSSGLIEESYEDFDNKWIFNEHEKWFLFLYEKDKIKIPFKGKYL